MSCLLEIFRISFNDMHGERPKFGPKETIDAREHFAY